MFDHKLLAAHAAIRHFRHFCHAFQLWTDHKLLVTALSRVSAPISPQQQCHLAFISEFNVQMLYLPSLKNIVANFLSCPPIWNCCHHGRSRSRWLQSHGCRAKPLRRNAVFVWRFILQTCFLTSRRSTKCDVSLLWWFSVGDPRIMLLIGHAEKVVVDLPLLIKRGNFYPILSVLEAGDL